MCSLRCSPLFNAVSEGNLDLLQKLVDVGADVNVTDPNGLRPIHAAIGELLVPACICILALAWCGFLTPGTVMGNPRAAQLLLELGAQIGHRVRGGPTVMHLAAGETRALFASVGCRWYSPPSSGTGQVESIKWLLGLDVAPQLMAFDNDLETPLDSARNTGNEFRRRRLAA